MYTPASLHIHNLSVHVFSHIYNIYVQIGRNNAPSSTPPLALRAPPPHAPPLLHYDASTYYYCYVVCVCGVFRVLACQIALEFETEAEARVDYDVVVDVSLYFNYLRADEAFFTLRAEDAVYCALNETCHRE